jgi:hypothetical protein
MTSPIPMTREELIELAALDAYGLLDDYEAALYTRSFHHAPAAVQDEILTLQAELAVSDVLEISDEPDGALRARVLAAVAGAIERESAGLGPLASIGHPRPTEHRAVIGRIGGGRSAQFWRAAAFVMMAAALVMAYFLTDALRQTNQVLYVALGIETEKALPRLVGPGFEEFVLNPNSQARYLLPPQLDNGAFAVVYVNPQTQQAFLAAFGLPAGRGQYTLEMQQSDGTLEPLGVLTTTGMCSILPLDGAVVTSLLSATIQITAGGETLLQTT